MFPVICAQQKEPKVWCRAVSLEHPAHSLSLHFIKACLYMPGCLATHQGLSHSSWRLSLSFLLCGGFSALLKVFRCTHVVRSCAYCPYVVHIHVQWTYNIVWYIYIIMRKIPQFNSLVWGLLTLAPFTCYNITVMKFYLIWTDYKPVYL